MKIKSINLDQVAGFPSQFPNDNFEEIAFAGRSNVGKSSFINSFLGKKNLAKTSSKPGKTKTINLYKKTKIKKNIKTKKNNQEKEKRKIT